MKVLGRSTKKKSDAMAAVRHFWYVIKNRDQGELKNYA